jgi:hypothetical protein
MVVALVAVARLTWGATLTLSSIALQGDIAPDGLPYVNFVHGSPPESPGVSDAADEHVVFRGETKKGISILQGPTASGGTSAVVLLGEPAPGGQNFIQFINNPPMNDLGTVVFDAQRTDKKRGVFIKQRGQAVVQIVLAGQANPGPGGGTLAFSNFAPLPDLNADDDVIFRAVISGNTNPLVTQGLYYWQESSHHTSALVQRLDAVPDRSGRFFCALKGQALGTDGIAFLAGTQLSATCEAPETANGIFLYDLSTEHITTVALQGEFSPLPSLKYSGDFSEPTINNSNQVAFQGSAGKARLFVSTPGSGTSVRVSVGDAIPAALGGGKVGSFKGAPVISDAGALAFRVSISQGTAPFGIVWQPAGGLLQRVALVGDPDPDGFGSFVEFDIPRISGAGKVAFKANVRPSDGSEKFRGVYVAE